MYIFEEFLLNNICLFYVFEQGPLVVLCDWQNVQLTGHNRTMKAEFGIGYHGYFSLLFGKAVPKSVW